MYIYVCVCVCVCVCNYVCFLMCASLVAKLVKNLPAMWETWVGSLGWDDPLEEGRTTHSSVLTWRIPWTVQSMGLQSQTVLNDFDFLFTFLMCQLFSHVQFFATPWTLRPPVSSVHGIFLARMLEWVAISFSRGSSQPRD